MYLTNVCYLIKLTNGISILYSYQQRPGTSQQVSEYLVYHKPFIE